MYFHTTWGLVHDAMHIFLEGVCRVCLKNLLKNLVTRSLFTIDEFNERLTIFDFGYCDASNIPTPLSKKCVSKKGSISQSGMHI